MFEIVTCPGCQRRLKVAAENLGKEIRCPHCAAMFASGLAWPKSPMSEPTEEKGSSEAQTGASPPPFVLDPINAVPQAKPEDREPRAEEEATPRLQRDRPRKGRTPAPVPSGRRRPLLILGIGAFLGLLVCSGIGVLAWIDHNFGNGNAFQEFRPLDPEPVLDAAEQRRQMDAFFHKFGLAIRGHNLPTVDACWDSQRTLDELFQERPGIARREGRQFQQQVQKGLTTGLLQQDHFWADHSIRAIKRLDNGELVVVTRHRDKALQGIVRFRWWLSHRSGTWKIYDFEDLDMGLRASMLLGSVVDRGPNGADQGFVRNVTFLKDAAQALAARQDFNEADRLLNNVDVRDLPAKLGAAYHSFRAVIRIRQNRFEDCIASCDEAIRLHADIPGTEYFRAIAYNHLKRHELALTHARRYHELMGDDYDICFEVALALHELQRWEEAAVFYRKSLDVEPNNMDALVGLMRCIGVGVNNADIAERFLKMDRPQDHFEECAKDRRAQFDPSTLEKLALAVRTIEPRNAEAAFYLALAQADLQRSDDAIKMFREALQFQGEERRRHEYYAEFARVLVAKDKALEIYPTLPEPAVAFRGVAAAFVQASKLDELEDLLHLYAQQNPGDPYLLLYRGELEHGLRNYPAAVKAYNQAIAKINDETVLSSVRPKWIFARYSVGDVLGTYRDVTPQRFTFQQLANLCFFDKKNDLLASLVEAHEKNDPVDPGLPQSRFRLKFRQGQFDEAGAIMREAVKADSKQRDSFLYDLIDNKFTLEAYRLAPDASEAFGFISADLISSHRWAELKPLMEVHRKKFPTDPIVFIAAAELAGSEKNWPGAAKEYKVGWKRATPEQRQRWLHPYLLVRYKAGEGLDAYRQTALMPGSFENLVRMALADKQLDLFAQLLEVRRLDKPDATRDFFEARLKVLRGNSEQAAELLRKAWPNIPEQSRQQVHSDYLGSLARADKGIEAYLSSPDQIAAFQQLNWRFRNPKQIENYDRLIREHARLHPADSRLVIERGELAFLRGDYARAEQQFVLATQNPADANLARYGLARSRIRLGKIVPTYKEFGPSNATFQELAYDCVDQKNPDQLKTLLAAHLQAFPKYNQSSLWELEILWLEKDYAGVVRSIQADRDRLFRQPNNRWKIESYLVRSLVHLKKFKDARKEAENFNAEKNGPAILLVLALTAEGDVEAAIRFVDKEQGRVQGQRYLLESFYRDEDLGPLLRANGFARFRERFPEPAPLNPGELDFDDER